MNKKNLEFSAGKQIGFKNRIYTLIEDFVFNNYTLRKGFNTDGGSIPKGLVLFVTILLTIYVSNWFAIATYAVGITGNAGWFMKCFIAHDQRWVQATSWWDFIPANWAFFKDILYKMRELEHSKENIFIKIHDLIVASIVSVIYPLTVTISPPSWHIFRLKLKSIQPTK